jgi:hypothetical protein
LESSRVAQIYPAQRLSSSTLAFRAASKAVSALRPASLTMYQLTEGEYREILQGALGARQALCSNLIGAGGARLLEMKHIPAGKSLGEFLLRQRTVEDFQPGEKALAPKQLVRSLGKLHQQVGEMRDRTRRVHFKSLGAILALQESIWKAASAIIVGSEAS